ncbi:MAG: phosphoribosylformylglycinamidine cyclo-ligase [Clostridia bacterium]|nr:phosphoribosylformylglycinamidine cyclo-ligase [Clostridia bacterium]
MPNNAYKNAGVDVEAGYRAVDMMKKHAAATHTRDVLTGLGSFGGLFSLENQKYDKPVLVSGADGVGTKLKYAFALNKHDTIGIDCVAMCANDVVCQGAKPLFFLDYLATGHLDPVVAAEVVSGVAEGCKQAGCALIGGETAEMPGFYAQGEYDLAGFCVGIVDRDRVITGAAVKKGDALVGLASSGLHSNGFSLVRKVFWDKSAALGEMGEALLTPTRIYVKCVLDMLNSLDIHGLSHITGGGFIENIPRMLPKGLSAKIIENSYVIPDIFLRLQKMTGSDKQGMYNTFNMGVGMVAALPQAQADKAIKMAKAHNIEAFLLGEVIGGEDGVVFA